MRKDRGIGILDPSRQHKIEVGLTEREVNKLADVTRQGKHDRVKAS
jgi:hypothetical protein